MKKRKRRTGTYLERNCFETKEKRCGMMEYLHEKTKIRGAVHLKGKKPAEASP